MFLEFLGLRKVSFFERGTLREVSNFVTQNYQTWTKENESFAIRLKKEAKSKKVVKKLLKK
jgi:hypothetical protein